MKNNLRQAHEILSQGVRGEHKMPGEFGTSQNWIGGASLLDAAFIPPAQHYVNPLMSDLENFLHNQEINVPALIRVGIAHYQFETIHPFLDGNGRIGRLLITLYLVSHGILDKPLLYLSVFFEKNKSLYYENLNKVRFKNDIIQWLKYFLLGVEETATNAVATLSAIMKLKVDTEKTINDKMGRRANSGLRLLNFLFVSPLIDAKDVEQACKLSTKAANDLISAFENEMLLKRLGNRMRNRLFAFEPYLQRFDSR